MEENKLLGKQKEIMFIEKITLKHLTLIKFPTPLKVDCFFVSHYYRGLNVDSSSYWIEVEPSAELRAAGITSIRLPSQSEHGIRVIGLESRGVGKTAAAVFLFDLRKKAFISSVDCEMRDLSDEIVRFCASLSVTGLRPVR